MNTSNFPGPARSRVQGEKERYNEWKRGDQIEVYSRSRETWYAGFIAGTYEDDDGEWVEVQVPAMRMMKECNRYSKDLRWPGTDDSASESRTEEFSQTEFDDDEMFDTSSEWDDSLDLVVIVDRCGTEEVVGKYVKIGVENNAPVFRHTERPSYCISKKYKDLWVIYCGESELYRTPGISKSKEPPSYGWEEVNGKLPLPGMHHHYLFRMADCEDFGTTADPFLEFEQIPIHIDTRPLGIRFEHGHVYLSVCEVTKGQHGGRKGVRVGDILVAIDGVDYGAPGAFLKHWRERNLPFQASFARAKPTIPVMRARHAGTKVANGEYQLEGTRNGFLHFTHSVHNGVRLYVDSIDDETNMRRWVISDNGVVLYFCYKNSDTPPLYGWEECEDVGKLPCPAFLKYPVSCEKIPTPVITSIKEIAPDAISVEFDCPVRCLIPPCAPRIETFFTVETDDHSLRVEGPSSPIELYGIKPGRYIDIIVTAHNQMQSSRPSQPHPCPLYRNRHKSKKRSTLFFPKTPPGGRRYSCEDIAEGIENLHARLQQEKERSKARQAKLMQQQARTQALLQSLQKRRKDTQHVKSDIARYAENMENQKSKMQSLYKKIDSVQRDLLKDVCIE